MSRPVRAITAVSLTAALAVALWPQRAVGETYRSSQLLWHEGEAFLFVGAARAGWHTCYVCWLVASLGAFGPRGQEVRRLTFVFRITSETIERYRLDGDVPELIAADGYVSKYVARWHDGKFEPYAPRAIPEALKRPPQEFSNIDGWSKRSFTVPAGGYPQTIEFLLDGRPARLVLSPERGFRSIDVERAGAQPERLLGGREGVSWVSKAEYEKFLRW